MLTENITWRNSIRITKVGIAAGLFPLLAGISGWMAYQADVLPRNMEMHGMIMGVFALVFFFSQISKAWQGFFILAGWYFGAGVSIPSDWMVFFGGHGGYVALLLFSLTAALPALIPGKYPKSGLLLASVVVAFSPIGAFTPLLAAMALFPSTEWLGLALALATLASPLLSGFKATHRKLLPLIGITCLGSSVANALTVPPVPPFGAWGLDTHYGQLNKTLKTSVAAQVGTSSLATAAIEDGARLVVTPEGVIDRLDVLSSMIWSKNSLAAMDAGAMVLIGAYARNDDGEHVDGLVDFVGNKFYPGTMPMVVGMWHPWKSTTEYPHFPIHLAAAPTTIPTPYGEAAYLMCYEELLVWPLLAKMTKSPALLIASANQWFATEKTLVAQERSMKVQARMWNLPVVRATNYSK